MSEIKQTVVVSNINNLEHSRLSWILFKQSSTGGKVIVSLYIWHRKFSLKGYHKISVLMQLAIAYVQMERYMHCVYRVQGRDIYSLPSSSPAWWACFVLSLQQFQSPWHAQNTEQTRLHCCNHIYMSCDWFHYCENISPVSVYHLVPGVLLRSVAEKDFRIRIS